ncbi:hypothetical protein [Streptomyces sp. SID14515]|uniref:hypothetical protein n=1 Tax=Streptomyces sp. SID14515 TaxID=2706074 RepID=UPI0013C9FEE9|nr:hypothetical protein [Streptomyces sp. SID14515]NEB42207.1 hypothetical protein [Streptomyces sp. SID14515]
MSEQWEPGEGRWLLLVENRGGADEPDGFRRMAVTEAMSRRPVVLLLVEEGVALAVPGSDSALDRFQRAGGRLAADRHSLARRGLDRASLRVGTRVTDLGEVAGWVLDRAVRVVWH